MAGHIVVLPHVLEDGDRLVRDLAGRRPAVFLDYDGTLAPIVDRPGIFVGRADDREVTGRTTAAHYVLRDVPEVERFLDTLTR